MNAPLPPPRCSRVAPTAALALALFSAVLVCAQPDVLPAIPDAPTVPVAPMLPDAAMLKQPMPPQVSQEIIEERPSSQHVWIAGHWRWQDGRYAWIAGRWELPPRANVSWVEPRWEKKGNGYILAGGYWQDAARQTFGNNVSTAAPAPPPPPREYIVPQPSPYHVWVGGYWGVRAGRHVWIGGRWEVPPRSDVVWVEPRWERRGHGYVLIEGYWEEATPVRAYGRGGREVIVVREPPPPRREVVPARPPGPGMIWVSGYWAWHGDRHIWVSGHYEHPPRARAAWVEPRWERRGGGYIFIEGTWR